MESTKLTRMLTEKQDVGKVDVRNPFYETLNNLVRLQDASNKLSDPKLSAMIKTISKQVHSLGDYLEANYNWD